ncbi:MAG TPA: sulfatase, partial [Chitinophagaceae bacterium]|nr:sulfatase [Chitinophagaceae bacterium]
MKKRKYQWRQRWRALAVMPVVLFLCYMSAHSQDRKMNIIFFLVDDLGWSDVQYNNPGTFYETPNVNQLAGEGMRFTNAYAACHVCSPSRASILTGKYPARLQLTDWLPGRKDYPFQQLKNVTINQQLPFEEKTLPETLKENGYRTAIIGKWHLGEDTSSPLQHGFDYRVTEWNKGWPLSYYSPFKLKGLEGPDGEYLTDRLTDEAISYIEQNKDAPFFLYLSHFTVHDPIEGRKDLVEKYRQKLARQPASALPPYILEANPDTTFPYSRAALDALIQEKRYGGYAVLPGRIVKVKQRQDNVQFAAMVESMDESLGRIMAKIKAAGLEDRTIIVFVSDNGGMSAANFARPSKQIQPDRLDKEFATSNLPLRGAKGWFYEGGIRVPMIIKWPGQSRAGLSSDIPVIGTDFYPTLLKMAGLKLKSSQHKDGEDLSPLLRGKKKLRRKALYWHFPHYSNHGMQSPGAVIREGKYKLLEYFEKGTVQLFDLEKDPGEQQDIAAQMPAKARKLTRKLHR